MTDQLTVSCEWLNSNLNQDGLVILDVTWDSSKDSKPAFLECHIPGAQYLDFMKHASHTDLFPRNIPESSGLEEQLRAAGVNTNSHVVVYENAGQAGFFIGSRAAWTLKLFGCSHVSVLDGGLQKWQADGYQTSKEVTTPKPGNIACEYNPSLRATFAKMAGNVTAEGGTKGLQVLDSRAADVYEKGHYPGAINIPFAASLLNGDKTSMKSVEELRQVFSAAGVDLKKPVVTMCNSGMSSCSLMLAAKRCGANAQVYHGGMTEWKNKSPDNVQ